MESRPSFFNIQYFSGGVNVNSRNLIVYCNRCDGCFFNTQCNQSCKDCKRREEKWLGLKNKKKKFILLIGAE